MQANLALSTALSEWKMEYCDETIDSSLLREPEPVPHRKHYFDYIIGTANYTSIVISAEAGRLEPFLVFLRARLRQLGSNLFNGSKPRCRRNGVRPRDFTVERRLNKLPTVSGSNRYTC